MENITCSIASFLIGFSLVFATPSMPFMIVLFLFNLSSPPSGSDAVGGFGADCSRRGKIEAASPNGRFIATSIRTICNDHSDLMHNETEVFVTSTRLERGAHLLTLERVGEHPAAIAWLDNQTLRVFKTADSTRTFSQSWCGISTELQNEITP